MVEPESEGQEIAEAGETAEGTEGEEEPRGGRRTRDFQANAVQNLQRARKSVTSPDADVSPRATMLVQSAIGWALLDLADAVRSHGRPEDDEPDE